jgi:Zn-dependent peptidase ImmA (M78 family)
VKKISRSEIAQEAAQVISQNKINSLPVDPLAIAENSDILVRPKPDTSCGGVSGMLCRVGNSFGIMYSTHIPNYGFQLFSIAHELGHYFLPGHIDAIDGLLNGDIHKSKAGSFSSDPYEKEADYFAAELLMPEPLFSSAIKGIDHGLTGIEHLSNLCRTSLTTTAIQYAKYCAIPTAIICSSGTIIDFCFLSSSMKEIIGSQWLKGQPLPIGSLTEKFNSDSSNISDSQRKTTITNIRDWFGGKHDIDICEEIIGLGTYGKTLTVLTTETFANELR